MAIGASKAERRATANYSLSERVLKKSEVLPIYANLRSIFGPKLSGHVSHVLGIGLVALLRWEFAFDFDLKIPLRRSFRQNWEATLGTDFEAKLKLDFFNFDAATQVSKASDRVLCIQTNRLTDIGELGGGGGQCVIGFAVRIAVPKRSLGIGRSWQLNFGFDIEGVGLAIFVKELDFLDVGHDILPGEDF